MKIRAFILVALVAVLALLVTGATSHISAMLDLNNVFSGNNTHTGTEAFKSINAIRFADQFTGATADVKINACLADAGTGGTCDARGLVTSPQNVAATIIVGASQSLILNQGTTYQPTANGVNMFAVMVNAHLDGASVDVTNLAGGYTGKVFYFPDQYANGNTTSLEHFKIIGTGTTVAGIGLALQSTSNAQTVTFVHISHGRMWGLNTGISFSASGGGWSNGNILNDVTITDSVIGVDFSSTSATFGNAVSGNLLLGYSYQTGVHTSFAIRNMSALGDSSYNVITTSVWDGGPISFTGAVAHRNMVIGDVNGTWTDTPGDNYLMDAFQGRFFLGQAHFPLGAIAYNNKPFMGFNAAGNATYNLCLTTPANAVTCGDSTTTFFLSGTNFNLNGSGVFNGNGGGFTNMGALAGITTLGASGLASLTGGFKAGASGSTISDSRNLAQLPATLTTTAAASDNVAITGVTASSKCLLTPTNASAATNVATTYVSAKTANQITVSHAVTASMTYDILCSVQ